METNIAFEFQFSILETYLVIQEAVYMQGSCGVLLVHFTVPATMNPKS